MVTKIDARVASKGNGITNSSEQLIAKLGAGLAFDGSGNIKNEGAGIGQTWVLTSNTNDQAYHNTTGKPISVSISGNTSNSGRNVQVSPDGVTYILVSGFPTNNIYQNITVLVPNGWYYKLVGSISSLRWMELR